MERIGGRSSKKFRLHTFFLDSEGAGMRTQHKGREPEHEGGI